MAPKTEAVGVKEVAAVVAAAAITAAAAAVVVASAILERHWAMDPGEAVVFFPMTAAVMSRGGSFRSSNGSWWRTNLRRLEMALLILCTLRTKS